MPSSVAIGDFNGDGHLDWAVSNAGDNSVWIYLGKGDGTANLPTIIPLSGVSPIWIAAVSLRGNGTLDLVVAQADSQTVGVLLGNGDGTFQPEANYAVPAPPLFVLGGDFNGDGKLDIAAGMLGSSSTGPIAVLPGDGQGHLGAALYTANAAPSVGAWLASADLNGDGKSDLVVVDPDDLTGPHAGVQAYLNNGNGTFTPGQLFYVNFLNPYGAAEQAVGAALADLNGDGCTDVVVIDTYGLGWTFTGSCNGTFNVPAFSQVALGDLAFALQLADVNHDGKLDLVTSGAVVSGAGGAGLGETAGNLVSVSLGDGSGHFQPAGVYRGEPSMLGLAAGDLNGDGFLDFVTANQGTNTASVFLNDGEGGFGDPQGEVIGYNSGVLNSPSSPFLFADVDGNGTKDLVVLESPPLSPGAMQITTMLNDGTGKFSAPIRSAAWPDNQFISDFVLADFRNTGKPDLLVIGAGVLFAPNIGGGKFGPFTLTSNGACCNLAVGDFNGDGKLDFVSVNTQTGVQAPQLSVFLGDGDGTFRPGQTVTLGNPLNNNYSVVLYVGDFNRDGKPDILALTDSLYEFLGNGDGTFQPARMLFSTFGVFVMADVNRDGWPDIIALSDQYGNNTNVPFSIPTVSVFLEQPDGSFQYSNTYTPYLDSLRSPIVTGVEIPGSPFDALLGDFNGDGNPDLAIFQVPWTGEVASTLQVLFGNGDGTLTPSYIVYPVNKLYVPQFAADVNGDGLADLIELDNFTSSFNVIKSAPNAPAVQVVMLTNPVTGNVGYGRVVLNIAATTATTVALTASDPNIQVPVVVIPAGTISQDFQFSIGSGFNPRNVFTLQAQAGASTAIAYGYVSSIAAPVIELEPTALLFGDVNVAGNSGPQTVTAKNLGSAPLTLSITTSEWVSETNNCGTSLAPQGSCDVQVTFTAPFVGLTNGGVNFFDNASGGSQQVVTQGFGRGLQLVPCCLNFIQMVGTTSPAQTVVMTNQETIPLEINIQPPYPGGQGFSETNNCSRTLPAGGSCELSVKYQPRSSVWASAAIYVTDNSSFDNTYGVNLNGEGSDFSLDTTVGTVTVNAGQTATYPFTAKSLNGFTGAITFSCTGAPTYATCTASPDPLNISSNNLENFTVRVITTARSSASATPSRTTKGGQQERALAIILGATLLAGIVASGKKCQRPTTILSLLLIVLTCSCGGGSSSSSGGNGGGPGGGGTATGTPSGTYTVTVKGTSGGLSHSSQVSLTVN